METATDKVFVLGLDGATFDFIRPLATAGRLPNLARLMREGAFGTLRSTIPPNSAPAWVSFATGVNPGKHGVYTFYAPAPHDYDKSLVSSYSVRSRTVWDLLGEQGRKVAVVGVPITFPPRPVNGVMISGQPVPSAGATFTYPATLHTELLINCGEYVLPEAYYRPYVRGDVLGAIAEVGRYTDSTKRAVLHLMETRPWDFFAVVFYTTDQLQHYGLRFQDEQYCCAHPRDTEKMRDLIPQAYERMDRVLGEIWARLDEDTTLIVMSDHGAHRCECCFFLNRWLIEEGYMALKRAHRIRGTRLRMARPRLGDVAGRIGMRKLCPRRLRRARVPIPRVAPRTRASSIDWRRTRAFADITTSPVFITINVRGRQPQGIVDRGDEYRRLRAELIERLMQVNDHLGRPVFDKIYTREELYRGPHVEEAGDIELETVDRRVLLKKDLEAESLVQRPSVPQGCHHIDGAIFLYGKHIKPGTLVSGAQIVDVAPTALYLMGHAVPEDMDGRVLADAVDQEWLAGHPIQARPAAPAPAAPPPAGIALSEEEKQRIERDLEALGYI